MALPPPELLASLYRELPFLVVHLTTDGIILHCNPATLTLTQYEEGDLVGRNFWATLFPGKLFAQVPKFISSQGVSPLLKDHPMTIRTRKGADRVIAFTRFHHGTARNDDSAAPRTIVLIGVDLTDRLLDTDKDALLETGTELPPIGHGTTMDDEIVSALPLPGDATDAEAAIKVPRGLSKEEAMKQVHGYLREIDLRLGRLEEAVMASETGALGALRQSRDAGSLALIDWTKRAERLQGDVTRFELAPLEALIQEILALYGARRA